jgi:hypothetical protein
MLRAYAIKDTMVISLIQQESIFKKMTLHDVLGKIINHEMVVKESQHIKNLSKGIISLRKQDIVSKLARRARTRRL